MSQEVVSTKVQTTVLGEELPIFCEKCGYALMGLPQAVCTQCEIRHFRCPECGSHQPINTLRPAFQKLFGRIRAGWLVLIVFIKLVYFGMSLFGWCVAASEMAYGAQRAYSYNAGPFIMDTPEMIACCIFALFWGGVGRLLLLRWGNGSLVGLVLAALLFAAMLLGAYITSQQNYVLVTKAEIINRDLLRLMTMTASVALLGSAAAWSIWQLLVRAFLPRRTAQSLLEWQRQLSVKAVATLTKTD